MSYNYTTQRPNLFTEEGQRLFLAVYERTLALITLSGAVREQEALHGFAGDSWDMIACLDRMVELGKIVEVSAKGIHSQYRVFVAAPK
jgi:hypothetical protein